MAALDWTFHPAGPCVAPTFLVLPGGGYSHHAAHEAEPVAEWLNGLGIHVAVLRYGVGDRCWPRPLRDAREALAELREGGTPLAVDRRRVGVIGFSAGGHLAALLSTDSEDVSGLERWTYADRPDAAILAYPVTDLRETILGRIPNLHLGSSHRLLGDDASPELQSELSPPTRVTSTDEAEMPPMFIWSTSDDETVPVLHSVELMMSLAVAGVPFEGHIFSTGRHGLGLAGDDPEVGQWTTLAAKWLASLGWLSPP